MSEELVVPSSEVIEQVPADEKTINPIEEKLTALSLHLQKAFETLGNTKAGKEDTHMMQEINGLMSIGSLGDDKFMHLMQALGLYQTDSNADEVKALEAKISTVKTALLGVGYAADSDTVKAATKAFTAELVKAQAKVKDNIPALSDYFGVKLTKGGTGRVYAKSGELAMHNPNLGELKSSDFIFKQNDKTAIIVHSQSVAQADLDKLGIKAESTTWIGFEYNGLLSYTRNRSGDAEARMVGVITSMPESWLKVHKVTFDGEKLSGLMGKVAGSLGLAYNGNGWQSNAVLPAKFEKVGRVVKEA